MVLSAPTPRAPRITRSAKRAFAIAQLIPKLRVGLRVGDLLDEINFLSML